MILKLTKIDTDGYNGREHAPEARHIDVLLSVIGARSVAMDSAANVSEFGSAVYDERITKGAATAEMLRHLGVGLPGYLCGADLVLCYTCVTMGYPGEIIEVMSHEVEMVAP